MIVVEQDDADFQQGFFGEMSRSAREFLTESWQGVTSSDFGVAARNVFERTKNSISEVLENESIRKLRASVRAARNNVDDNSIIQLSSIGSLQHAPGAMQHLIMANPFARSLYHKNLIDGYSDSYTDIQPGVVGEDHVHYRLAMNGMEALDPTDNQIRMVSYSDEELDLYEPLDIVEQSFIQCAWERTNDFLSEGGDDPTSIYNSSLGRAWTNKDISDLFE